MKGIHPLLPLPLRWAPFGRAMEARRQLLEYVQRVVKERRLSPVDDAINRMMSVRDDEGNVLDDEELSRQILFLLFAGHESTTSLFAMACHELLESPLHLSNLRREQERFSAGPLTVERLDEMTSLEHVVLEVERLYPPFTGAFRHVTRSFDAFGHTIPEGWQLFYCISGTQHMEHVFSNPQEFCPARFEQFGEREARHSCSLVGFGNGAHVCVGKDLARLEVKIMLALLARKFDVRRTSKEQFAVSFFPSIRPKRGLSVRLTMLSSNVA
jgi:cytochrome P450